VTRRLTIQPQAEIDVADAIAWYEEQRRGLGGELLSELDSVMQRAVQTPFQFPQLKSNIRRALLRRFPYSVYFRVSDEIVELLAVLHQHRDPGTWQQRIVAE
jgi:plasmid stabilization system protein ParE